MRFRSPLLTQSLLFSFPAGTKMFQFPAFASFIKRMIGLQPTGLSHSEIRGSRVICTLPRLIAAYHVLHRLREPRHPPYALNDFLLLHTRKAIKQSARLNILSAHCQKYCFLVLYSMSKNEARRTIHKKKVQPTGKAENNGVEPLNRTPGRKAFVIPLFSTADRGEANPSALQAEACAPAAHRGAFPKCGCKDTAYV